MTIQSPQPPAQNRALLDPAFMARLDQLDVMSRKLLAGKMKGERRSKQRGQSVEFADYRNYVVGDDLRFIDWNIYARLDRLFLKLFLEEEDLSLYVLLDVSKSCDYGNPNKAFYLKQVAAALGYIGLVNYNRVSIAAMADGIVAETGAMRGRRRVSQMIDFVSKLQPAGPSHLAEACQALCAGPSPERRAASSSPISSTRAATKTACAMSPAESMTSSACRSFRPQEIEPDLQGDLKLRDMEDDDTAEVSITQPLVKRYKANLNAYCLSLKDYITRRGGTYLFTSTAVPFDTLVLNYLRERGLLG